MDAMQIGLNPLKQVKSFGLHTLVPTGTINVSGLNPLKQVKSFGPLWEIHHRG